MSSCICHNLGDILQGYLVSNIRDGIGSKYFPHHECNCKFTARVNFICDYIGECISCWVVYKVTCQICLSIYVGNTQNTLKKRMEQHIQDVDQKVHYEKNGHFCGPRRSTFQPKIGPTT